MYKKFVTQLFLCNMMLITGFFCVKGTAAGQIAASPAFSLTFVGHDKGIEVDRFYGMPKKAASGQRVVDYSVLDKSCEYELSEADYEALLQIVQAVAGNEDETGKMLVAGVVLNRVKNDMFPDTVTEVVLQQVDGTYQFSPVANGSYYSVQVTEETEEAVDKVLAGEDVTCGALYFAARKYADPEKMKWFDNSLVKLFTYGGHEFFTNG